jgi:trans-aconitate methyltransferase
MTLISDEYKKHLETLQKNNKFKGQLLKYDPVKDFIKQYNPASIIEYGCAKGTLVTRIQQDFPTITVDGYDPGVAEFDRIPDRTYDCLISNDVIEHFEPDQLEQSLEYMNTLFTKCAWLIIACYPAKKSLPDGRNAHLIIESPDWWMEKIKKCFTNTNVHWSEVTEFFPGKPEIRIILTK